MLFFVFVRVIKGNIHPIIKMILKKLKSGTRKVSLIFRVNDLERLSTGATQTRRPFSGDGIVFDPFNGNPDIKNRTNSGVFNFE